mmetsp:Transcript_28514/g.37300  ORF Transcript_28514/g.37300 Transcript_28514/m.37300 type:complete len:169 (+) Transcript_28514:144-650(+)
MVHQYVILLTCSVIFVWLRVSSGFSGPVTSSKLHIKDGRTRSLQPLYHYTRQGQYKIPPERSGFPGFGFGYEQEIEEIPTPPELFCKPGKIDKEIQEKIQPALKVLGQSVDLLGAEDGILRFHYHAHIKDKTGLTAFAKHLIKEHYPELKEVYMETMRVKDRRDSPIH